MNINKDKYIVDIIEGSEEELGFINPDDVFLRIDNRLSEFNTSEIKLQARQNLDAQVIDQAEY